MTSKQKGDYAELRIALDLVRKGYGVLQPFGDDHRFDLAAYKGSDFKRIQCKYAGSTKLNGVIKVVCRSNNRTGGSPYQKSEVDLIGVYHPGTDVCYYVPIDEVAGMTNILLRVTPPKSGQQGNIRWASDYLEISG